jgi:hypothetical protein
MVLGLLAWPAPSRAEKVTTNQATKLYSRAGEQSPVILKLKSGQAMTVLARDGRWLKVRVSGRTGWVPRSKVDLPDSDDELARNTRRRPFVDGRSTKRGNTGESGPEDRVGADALGEGDDDRADARPARPDAKDAKDAKPEPKAARSEPRIEVDAKARAETRSPPGKADDDDVVRVDDDDDKPEASAERSDRGARDKPSARPVAHVARPTVVYNQPESQGGQVFTADKTMALYVTRTQGAWTRVSTEDGDAGWILSSKLDIESPEISGGPRRRMIDARARLGVAIVSQSLITPGGGQTPPDNYTASSSSLTLALGGAVLYPYSRRYWLGGDLAYDLDRTLFGGVNYQNKTTAFTYHNFNVRAVGGYDLQKQNGMIAFARLGFHYDSYQVADVGDFTKNTAKLPNQIISAPTIGAALAIPRFRNDLGLTVSVDTVLVGARVSQTKNLEDGTGPSAKAVYAGGSLIYRWKPKMDLQLTADLAKTWLSFAGMPPATSLRGHTGTAVSSGTDFSGVIAFGLVYGL